jgi:hypothetical protein
VGRTVERGYGQRHRELRRRFAPLVASGSVCCWRCGELIAPWQAWDLGHDDDDRRRYQGPEHASCNRRASVMRTNRRRAWERTTEAAAIRYAEQYELNQWRLRVERERLRLAAERARSPRTPRIY